MKLRGNDGNTLQMAYVKRPSVEVSYSDLYLNFFDDYYSRDYIVFIIKLLDEVQKLSKK
jgi:spore coat protein CotH